jgi:hypothetical protein
MIEAEQNIHINQEWHPFPALGSYFFDGGRGSDEEIAEVEWDRLDAGDRERLEEIRRELMEKALPGSFSFPFRYLLQFSESPSSWTGTL